MDSASSNVLVKDIIREKASTLTASERQAANILLRDYPISGLQSITKFADLAEVSTPTIVRLSRKLGFEGFPDMQDALHVEAAAQIKAPLSKQKGWDLNPEDDHILSNMAQSVTENLQETLTRLDRADFDNVVDILSDTNRDLFIVGGRITRSNADYLFNHLQIIRKCVNLLSQTPNVWPQYLLDMDESSVLVIFDIRRYERDLMTFAKLAKERETTLILFTDQWGSPISKLADAVFNVHIEAPSSWDSTIAIMFIIEALISQINNNLWNESSKRIEELESMFSSTRLFRKLTTPKS